MDRFRTDMAVELAEARAAERVAGIREQTRQIPHADATLHQVVVEDADAARRLGKPMGRYITLDCRQPWRYAADRQAIVDCIAEQVRALLPPLDENAPVLVVGLGNRNVTPDALGAAVVERLLVTRHMAGVPGLDLSGIQCVCAIAPGVLGVTGLQTAEVVGGIVKKLRPAALVCIDALAARKLTRIGSSVQLCDTGIRPGSGVGEGRQRIDRHTLGIPVVCIGVPLVSYAATIASDALEAYLDAAAEGEAPRIQGDRETLLMAMYSTASQAMGNCVVTPKEVDALVEDTAGVLANAIDQALQPALSAEELRGWRML